MPGEGQGPRVRAVAAWLSLHPSAHVAALGLDALPTAIPEEVQLGPGHAVEDRSLLDLVVAEDRERIATGYVTARRTGQGAATARLAETGRTIAVHYMDLNPELPVCLRVHEEGDGLPVDPPQHVAGAARARVGSITKDEAARVVALDDGATELLGWDPGEVIGSSTLDLIHPDDRRRALESWWLMLLGSGRQVVRVRYRRGDGSWLWLDTSNSYDRGSLEVGCVTCQIVDVSREMEATDALRRNEELLRRLAETVPVGMCFVTTDRAVTYVNPRLTELLGTIGVTDVRALEGLATSDGATSLPTAIDAALDDGRDGELDVTLQGGGRSPVRCRATLSVVFDDKRVAGVLICVVDITELKTQATVDPLTGLLNRHAVRRLLSDALNSGEGRTGVLFIDLNTFKAVNDDHGHHVGDQLLGVVGERLLAAVRDGDLVGRVGGDEFMVLCPRLSHPDDLEGVAARIVTAFRSPFSVAGMAVSIGVSIGMAVADEAGEPADEVVARADEAMYRAKREASGPVWAGPLRRDDRPDPPAPSDQVR